MSITSVLIQSVECNVRFAYPNLKDITYFILLLLVYMFYNLTMLKALDKSEKKIQAASYPSLYTNNKLY